MRDRARSPAALGAGHPAPRHVGVPERDAARVLHRAGVEVGHEGLVVLPEGVADPEELVEVVEGRGGHGQHVGRLRLELGAQRLPDVQAERDAVVLPSDRGVRPGDEGGDVGRERVERGDPPPPGLLDHGRPVAQHGPVLGRGHLEGVPGLEVRLVEAGEPARRRVQERHGVEVRAPVGRVDVAVQALAVARVSHHPLDLEHVVLLQPVQRDPGALPGRGVDRTPVEHRRDQLVAREVDERRVDGAGEPDHGARGEGRQARVSQVEGDLHAVDAQHGGTGLGLDPGQAGAAVGPGAHAAVPYTCGSGAVRDPGTSLLMPAVCQPPPPDRCGGPGRMAG